MDYSEARTIAAMLNKAFDGKLKATDCGTEAGDQHVILYGADGGACHVYTMELAIAYIQGTKVPSFEKDARCLAIEACKKGEERNRWDDIVLTELLKRVRLDLESSAYDGLNVSFVNRAALISYYQIHKLQGPLWADVIEKITYHSDDVEIPVADLCGRTLG